ncbi:MAG: DNA polymerase I [Armatimonadetes bacterium]|nr:DNA polymerase I [Armatimonadota bacterium]
MPQPKLVVIDGYSLLFRAFYAMPGLSLATGEPTGAIYGFVIMLLKLLEEQKPDAFVVAFDAPAKSFRHEEFEFYKAHRPQTPDALLAQIGPVKEIVSAFHIPILEVPGVEADDVAGTVAKRGAEEGYEVILVTGDMDFMQLVSDADRIRVMMNRKGMADTVLYDEAAVMERYGLEPSQVADYKALRGDPSDNIPGLPGIGEKTAARLLQQFGTLENLLERIGEVKEAKVRKILEEGAEQVMRYKALTRIITDVGIESGLEDWKLAPPDADRLAALFERWRFRSLLGRIPSEKPVAVPSRSTVEAEAAAVASREEWERVSRRLRESGRAALRVALYNGTLGIALALAPGEVYWLAAGHREEPAAGQLSLLSDGDSFALDPGDLKAALEDPSLAKSVHDAKEEWHKLAAFGIDLKGVAFDAMLADYLLNPTRSQHPLNTIAEEYLHAEVAADPFTEGPPVKKAASEASALAALTAPMSDRLRQEEMLALLEEVEMPLWPILAEMEAEGVRVDAGWLENLSKELQVKIDQVQGIVYDLAGEEFNISSPKQLQTILFEKLKLPSGKKTKTGYSTDAQLLESLSFSYEIAARILEFRELVKLKSTYTDALPRLVSPKTGRLHTHLNQAVTATGRLSSSEPNLQNIPIRTAIGREIRKAFIARPGCRLLSADYSQIDLRVLAHISGDDALREAFRTDQDIHAFTARGIFHVEEGAVTPEMRRKAKAINFGIIYGMSDFRLSNEVSVPIQEAKQYIEDYFNRYPGVRRYIDTIIEDAREKGCVRTLTGRRRLLPEINDRNRNVRLFGERVAINTPIQGTAADMIKIAMVQLRRKMREGGFRSPMLLQVHDELIFEVCEDEIASLTSLAKETMETAFPLDVPVKVDVKLGNNWAEMEKIG